ncbi:MAG TPA: TetR/AcrR family transcriptional regulator [Candidatus Eisenbacteria bacterium]
MDAALDSFVERGFAATKLEDVARRAGITKGTMYLYFPSKEAVFQAVVRESIVPVIAEGEALVAGYQGSARDLIALMVRRWWETVGESRLSGIPKLVMAEASNFPELAKFYHREVVERGRELFGRAIQLGIDRGEFRTLDVPLAVRLLLAPLVFVSIWKHSFVRCDPRGFDVRAFVDLHLDTYLRGIAAPSGAAS